APPRIVMLLEGESLLNDATAIVLFGILISAVIMPDAPQSAGFVVLEFGRVLAGGIVTGLVLGGFAGLLIRYFTQALHHTVVSLAFAYLSFVLADSVFHVSSIMAVLTVGLTIAHFLQSSQARDRKAAIDTVLPFWGVLKYIAGALAFLLVGVTINLSFFTDLWIPLLAGISAVLVARVITVYMVLPVFTIGQPSNKLTLQHKHVLFGGGVRGAITAALALSLPVELEGWWIAQSIGYGVVIFSLFVQTPLLNRYLSRQRWK
ncbi:MAG TPA: sodium:proton antiporter, partial [Gammaproteobacteria bacterium]|nr:sodium:proton antiporter [Gammaproteobacteria bacterium]